MKSMRVFSLKVIGSPAFQAGSLFMYEKVDSLINISKLVEESGIKAKGVSLSLLVKALVTGVLNGKKSVSKIFEDIKSNGAAKYIGRKVDAASQRNFFRAIEKLGTKKAKKLFEAIVDSFEKRFGFDFSQTNIDFTSSFFVGNKCKIAKHGHSKDHRPDKPQIKLGLVQCGKQIIPFNYIIDEGEAPDVKQFGPTFNSIKKKLPAGSLVVFDKGGNSEENRKLVAKAKHIYLSPDRMTKKLKRKIMGINKRKMQKVDGDAKCLVKEVGEEYCYYFFSKKAAKQAQQRRARKVAEQLKAAEELREKMKHKTFKPCKVKKKIFVSQLVEEQIVTEVTVHKRLISKKLETIKKELLDEGKELDGWIVLRLNKKLEPKQALTSYRDKDSVEKLICSLKQNCKLRPFNVWKNESVKGSVFISMLAQLVLGCFQWANKSLKNKSHKSILETVNRLTLALKTNKHGKIIEVMALNVTGFLKKLFPQLQT